MHTHTPCTHMHTHTHTHAHTHAHTHTCIHTHTHTYTHTHTCTHTHTHTHTGLDPGTMLFTGFLNNSDVTQRYRVSTPYISNPYATMAQTSREIARRSGN